jgi:hypothetical protein
MQLHQNYCNNIFGAGCASVKSILIRACVPVLLALNLPCASQEAFIPLTDEEYADSLLSADSTFQDSVVMKDTIPTADYVQVTKGPVKLRLVKRGYVYRQQIGLAMGMMAFVTLILVTSQNWNPD